MSLDGVMTRLNPLVAGLLRSPAHWLASPGLLLLRVTGRHSGKQYELPVGYQRDGDAVVVLVSEASNKQWWRNFREPRAIGLRLRGRDRTGIARVVDPSEDEFRQRVEATLRRVPGMARVFRVTFDRKRGLTAEQVEGLAAEVAVVHIDLDPA
jgi:deazaflavin-dependent oxidoreductase (nitroreductase family)